MFAINENGAIFAGTATGTLGQVLRSAGTGATTWGSGLGSRTTLTDLDIPSAVATCTTVTGTVTCTVGEHVEITPLQDDAAWDTGTLLVFCESANVVKVTYCAPVSGNPAATNDYFIDVTTP